MKIELYLRKIDQDFLKAAKGKAKKATPPPVPQPGCRWFGSWTKCCCVVNCVTAREKARPHTPIVKKRTKPCLFMRAEPDGGLIWDSATGAVYKVDDEAYEALGMLDHGVPPRKVAHSLGVSFTRVDTFVNKVRKLGR